MKRFTCFGSAVVVATLSLSLVSGLRTPTVAAEPADATVADQVVKLEKSFTAAFNEGQAETLVALFLPDGEWIDDAGVVHRGQQELQTLFDGYFERFPEAKLAVEIESIRALAADLAIEEGTRYLSAGDDSQAQVRYVATLVKRDTAWRIASIREFDDRPLPTPASELESIAWMIGDWVSEGGEPAVTISYRWADDRNFVLGQFRASRGGEVVMKSEQRIGWDPLSGELRSWLFDADGGFAEGDWTFVDGDWVIKSRATAPDGLLGSATVTITRTSPDQFRMVGTDRIIAGQRADDFDVSVNRAPPKPSAQDRSAPDR